MKQALYSISLFATLIISSCNSSKNAALIIGKWQGSAWLVNNEPSKNNAKATFFTFNDKSEYSFDYAGTIEKGTYKVDNNRLYSTPTDQQEMMVKIAKLTADSLVFDMNRGGQPETLILLKKQ